MYFKNGTTKIIWAFGDELELAYHKTENRGVANLLLLAPEDVDSKEILKNTTDLTFIMSNVII